MNPLDQQTLDDVHEARNNSALLVWCGQFTPEFVFERSSNPIEFEGIRNQFN